MNDVSEAPALSTEPPRRNLFRKTLAVVCGALALAIPGGAGLAVLLDPLRRQSRKGTFLRVTTLGALPTDGTPRRFPVLADRTDAWSMEPQTRIGSVYLQRHADKVVAFNTHCPHLGCPIDAIPGDGFGCPCHSSKFNSDGTLRPGSVSPRGMDELEVDVEALKSGVVNVRYQDFVTGITQKIAKS
jgi:menaquinol-cytochrome c reductase iron-sulfur subunit